MSTAARSSNSTRAARLIRRTHASDRRRRRAAHRRRTRRSWRWLTGRLMDREVVTVSRLEDLPMEALAEREYARRSGLSSMLAVPVDDRRANALARSCWAASQRYRDWHAPIQDRARLLAGIICSALQRSRQNSALRASMAEIAAAQPPADCRQRLPQGRHQDVPRFRRDRRRERGDARRPGTDRAGRAAQLRGPAARRNGHGQGTVRPCRPRTEPSPVAARWCGSTARRFRPA